MQCINDVSYIDTFFSLLLSVQGFQFWNLDCFRRTGFDVVFQMRHCSQSPTTSPKLIADCGAPTVIESDNAPEFKGKRLVNYLSSTCMSIRPEFMEARHPNENLAGRLGGALKAAIVHLMKITGCSTNYLCFALELVCLFWTVAFST